MSASTLVLRYAAFAGLAIAANLAAQNFVLWLADHRWWAIYAAIGCGNAAGLMMKFVLDKLWIFDDGEDTSMRSNARKFVLYTTFGVLTTAIFWGMELLFHYAFESQFMTNVGAVIGLIIGYTIKFQLDHRFTFRRASSDPG